MKLLGYLLFGICIVYACIHGKNTYEANKIKNEYRYDYAEINKIKYGLFNLDLWKTKLFDILNERISDFEITERDLVGIRRQVELYLEDLYKEYFESGKIIDAIVEAQQGDEDEKKLGKLFVGLFRKNIEKEIKKIDFKSQIPAIADNLMLELKRKIPDIKSSISQSISDILAEELKTSIADQRIPIYEKYGAQDFVSCNTLIKSGIEIVNAEIASSFKRCVFALLASLIILLAFASQFRLAESMSLLTVVCTVSLALGLALPMIDLDARLSALDITLLGSHVHFDEQVMYFQSKSIIDVTITLMEGRGLDLKIVGLLILLFSIVLPFLKMLFTLLFLFIKNVRQAKLVRVLIFYMGKWSMADVFVVAIFMSYIGFYGLINSMLGDFSNQSYSSMADTVNYSRLSSGIVFFTAYCILSILMSSIINRKFKKGSLLDLQLPDSQNDQDKMHEE